MKRLKENDGFGYGIVMIMAVWVGIFASFWWLVT